MVTAGAVSGSDSLNCLMVSKQPQAPGAPACGMTNITPPQRNKYCIVDEWMMANGWWSTKFHELETRVTPSVEWHFAKFMLNSKIVLDGDQCVT